MRCLVFILLFSAATVFALDDSSFEHASGNGSNVPHVSDDEDDMPEGSGSGVGMNEDDKVSTTSYYETTTTSVATSTKDEDEVPEEEYEDHKKEKNNKQKTEVIIEEIDVELDFKNTDVGEQPRDDVFDKKFPKDRNFDQPSKEEVKTTSVFQSTHFLTAVIIGGGIGLVFAIALIGLLFYRMRKKDEGSYSIDEKKHGAPPTYQYTQGQEYYA